MTIEVNITVHVGQTRVIVDTRIPLSATATSTEREILTVKAISAATDAVLRLSTEPTR